MLRKRVVHKDMDGLNGYAAKRLREMASSMGDLAKSFGKANEEPGLTREDGLAALEAATAMVCGGCNNCGIRTRCEQGDEEEAPEGEEGAETPADAPSEGSAPQRSILDEIEFFKNIQGINFNETDAGISLEITNDSLVANEGNLELGSYLSDYNSLESFYTNMGYTCYKETL